MEKEIMYVDGSITFKHLPKETLSDIWRLLNCQVYDHHTDYSTMPEKYYTEKVNV